MSYSDNSMDSGVTMLRNEYLRRKSDNPGYSLRAFAKRLKCPPGRLSEIFSGKRNLTPRFATAIIDQIGWSPEMVREFYSHLAKSLLPGNLTPLEGQNDTEKQASIRQLEEDQFSLISEWYHFAILSLMETDDFKSDTKWIAARLGLDFMTAESALQRLFRLQLISLHLGELKPCQDGVKTTTDISCHALRKSHRQTLQRTMNSLDDIPIELRDVTSITMAIDTNKIGKAKEAIRRFRRDIMDLLESDVRSEVYELSIQLMPVSKQGVKLSDSGAGIQAVRAFTYSSPDKEFGF